MASKQKQEIARIAQPPQYMAGVVADIMGAFMIPGGSTVSTAIQHIFKKRLDGAREVLLEEIKDGSKDISDAAELEEIAAIIYRYGRAAQEGAARTNLRLLAKVIAGQMQASSLNANDFLYYADILSSLKAQEIQLLGIMIREGKTTSYSAKDVLKEHFIYEETIEEIFQSLLRTGLVVFSQEITVEDQDDHKSSQRYKSALHTDYQLTAFMQDDVCKWVNFADAVAKEQS